MTITKNDLVQALQRNFKKKNTLVYLYFQELIDSAHSSSFVRMKIFEEIGIELSKTQLDTIRYRMDKTTAKRLKANISVANLPTIPSTKETSENQSSFSDPFRFNKTTEKSIIKKLE